MWSLQMKYSQAWRPGNVLASNTKHLSSEYERAALPL